MLASVAMTVKLPAPAVIGLVADVPFTVYVILPVPPLALKLKLPLPPLHKALLALAFNTTALGSLIVTDVAAEQPFASVATIA